MNMYNMNLTSIPAFSATVNDQYLFINAKKCLLSEKDTTFVQL